jgi:hypothetical protein
MAALDPLNGTAFGNQKRDFYVERLSLNDLSLGVGRSLDRSSPLQEREIIACHAMTYHDSSC